jgi:hypothetical protein
VGEHRKNLSLKLLDLSGLLAEGSWHLKHATSFVLLLASAGASASAFALDHTYVAAAALAIFASGISAAGTYIVVWRRNLAKACCIAHSYAHLQTKYLEFETEVLRLLKILRENGELPSNENLRDLRAKLNAYLQEILITAAKIFAQNKPRKGKFSGVIYEISKGMNSRDPLEATYKPTVWTYTDTERARYDTDLQNNPPQVRDNYPFRQVLSRDVAEDFFIHYDLRELANELRGREVAREPSDLSPNSVRSLIVYPIYGRMGFPAGPKNTARYKNYAVFGLMCIDSPKRFAFTNRKGKARDHDLNVMQQLASYAFSSFLLMRAIEECAKRQKPNGLKLARNR